MKKNFKWLVSNGHVLLLHRTVGLFGEQWEGFGNFDDRDGNAARGKHIIKLLNECDKHTDHPNDND